MRVDLPDGRAVVARLRPPGLNPRLRFLTILLIVAGGVGLAAFPVTARLTRRLEALRSGVEQWGAGALSLRVDGAGDDEVAVVARTFNASAARVEELLASQKALLANASHELRSPLARLRLAIELWFAHPSPDMHAEIVRNLAESDQLVEEILLASRLDHIGAAPRAPDPRRSARARRRRGGAHRRRRRLRVERRRTGEIDGDATLLRRLIRNLLENAAKHGRPPITIAVTRRDAMARIVVADAGEGIAAGGARAGVRAFYRPAGRAELLGRLGPRPVAGAPDRRAPRRAAICEAAPGGGSRFVVELASRSGGQTHNSA